MTDSTDRTTNVFLTGMIAGAVLYTFLLAGWALWLAPSVAACQTLAAAEGRYGAYANPGYGAQAQRVCIIGDVREIPKPRKEVEHVPE